MAEAEKTLKKTAIILIRCYQVFFSRLFVPSCRFYPSCSSYAILAIEEHGVFKGGVYSLVRLLKCQPFCKGGYDPVKGK